MLKLNSYFKNLTCKQPCGVDSSTTRQVSARCNADLGKSAHYIKSYSATMCEYVPGQVELTIHYQGD